MDPSSTPVTLRIQPGFFSEAGDRDAVGRWKTGDRVRFKNGLPEKMGGWELAPIVNNEDTTCDEFLDDVVLLCFGRGVGTAFVDDSPLHNTVTGTTGGTPTQDGTIPLFGANAISMPASNSRITWTTPSVMYPDTQDFTFEAFIYLNDSTLTNAEFNWSSSTSQPFNISFAKSIPASMQASMVIRNPAHGLAINVVNGAIPHPNDTWVHIAIVRHGSDFLLFVGGVLVLSDTYVGSIGDPSTLPQFTFGANSAPGRIGQLRYTMGVARYTAPFSPPTESFTAQACVPLTAGTIEGIDRREHEWDSLDGQPWLAQGTSKKLYVVNRNIRYDITPIRRTISVTDPFTTISGDNTVAVLDVLHGAETGDFVHYTSGTVVGGLTLGGEYAITVINGNQYTIEAATAATSSATGGGAVAMEYEINVGLDSAEQAHGWGTCTYGTGTYGTRRGDCSAMILGPRLWSLDNFGEDLLASPRGGSLYWWDRSLGPGSRAVLVETAPPTIERMLVSPSGDQVIALGAFDNVAGSPDKMLVRASAIGTFADWDFPIDPEVDTTVFDKRLTNGSRILTGFKTYGGVLIETDKASYFMRADSSEIFVIGQVATENTACGPNACTDVNGTGYWMAQNKIMSFDGVQQEIPCPVWGYVFDNDAAAEELIALLTEDGDYMITESGDYIALDGSGEGSGFNRAQADKVYCYYNQKGDEITWLYPSAFSEENNRYLCYNRTERVFYYGTLERTAMSTGGLAYSLPYGSAPTGELFLHEGVPDADGETMDEFIESWDMQIGDGLTATHLSFFVPDFKRWTGTMRLQLKVKDRPRQIAYTTSTYDMPDSTIEQSVRVAGRQIAIRFGSIDLGSSWRLAPGSLYGQPDASR